MDIPDYEFRFYLTYFDFMHYSPYIFKAYVSESWRNFYVPNMVHQSSYNIGVKNLK